MIFTLKQIKQQHKTSFFAVRSSFHGRRMLHAI